MSKLAIVTEVRPPLQSRLTDWYRDADLLDAFLVHLPGAAEIDIRSVGHAVLGHPAPWFRFLLAIRDGAVARLGIQTSAQIRDANDGRARIDFFPVLSVYDDELILGEDDRHLDVRISLLVQKSSGDPDIVIATTAVRCHNLLGRTYLLAIGPFHRLAVRSYLRRAARSGLDSVRPSGQLLAGGDEPPIESQAAEPVPLFQLVARVDRAERPF